MIRVAGPDELFRCIAIRHEVFVVGQGVSLEEEVDGLDPECLHLLAELDGEPVGTARMRVVPPSKAKAERVAVRERWRGRGLGRAIMEALEHRAREQGLEEMVLNAQQSVIGFYEELGYTAHGPVFLDANIPHRAMRKAL